MRSGCLSAYLYMIKIRILISLTYRFEAISAIAMQFILLLVNSMIWRVLYANNQVVQDTTLNQMLIYTVMSIFLTCFYSTGVEGRIRSGIRDGNVAVDYIKPVNLYGLYFSEDIGQIVVNFLLKGLPILIFGSIFVSIPVPSSFLSLCLFVVSAVFSFLILWFIAAIFGIFNFWLIDIGPIGMVKDHIINFLSGAVIPIWFFPSFVQDIMNYTPFVYIYQTPISFFIEKTPVSDAWRILAIQAIWCLVFYILFRLCKKKAFGRLIVQGG